MYTIAIWNKRSTNYNANAFVKENGTETFQVETTREALLQIGYLINDPQIKQIVFNCPWWKGRLIWVQPYKDESYEHDECNNCPGNDCDGCPYDEEEDFDDDFDCI